MLASPAPLSPAPKSPDAPARRLPPNSLSRTTIQESLERLLPSETVRQLARDTGFVVRERAIEPETFVWSLILGFGVELHRSLEELREAYIESADLEDLAHSSYNMRFTPELCEFLRRCLQVAIANLAKEPDRELDPRLKAIADGVVIKDSSVVRLHASLAKKFPATRSRKVAAGLKVDALISVCANGPKSVALVGERTADIKTLRLCPWDRGRILLADLGYYSHRHFAKIAEHGGFFVSRLKENADPLFVRSNTVHRGRAIDLKGKYLSEVLPHLDRGILDAEVELTYRKRGYNGRRASDTFTCRLVAVWDEKARRYHTYLTNIGPERLSAEEVATLYSMRSEIELTFKEMKSSYALDKFKTRNEHAIQALIWAALLTLVVSRRLQNEVRKNALPEHRPRYTQLRWGRAFRRAAQHVLTLLLHHLGLGPSEKDAKVTFPKMNRALTRFSLDTHVSRHRIREEWSS